MIDRVIENWLSSINERQYQIPFCQVLETEGERVVYISSHGPQELGKDIVTIASDGVSNAYQLKAGAIDMGKWREIKGEIEQLCEYPLDLPVELPPEDHRPFFVSNGRINEPVLNAIRVLNEGLRRRRIKKLTTIDGSALVDRFRAAHGTFLPHEPLDLRNFLQLYVRDGREPLAKAELARFFERVLQLDQATRKPLEVQRAVASLVLLNSYLTHDAERRSNHWAVFESWVVTASYIYATAVKYSTDSKYYSTSLSLCKEAASRALEGLHAECEANRTKFVEMDILDGLFYGPRLTILAGLLGAHDLVRQKQYKENPDPFVALYLKEYLRDSKFWGESAFPFYVVACMALAAEGRSREAEILMFQLLALLSRPERFSPRGIPNPYYGPEDVVRLVEQLEPLNDERFLGMSYALETAVQYMARRLLRTTLMIRWYDISHVRFATFVPAETWQWFVWRANDGNLRWTEPRQPQSWSQLLEQSENPDSNGAPEIFRIDPTFTLYFIMVFPHRCQPHFVQILENWLFGYTSAGPS